MKHLRKDLELILSRVPLKDRQDFNLEVKSLQDAVGSTVDFSKPFPTRAATLYKAFICTSDKPWSELKGDDENLNGRGIVNLTVYEIAGLSGTTSGSVKDKLKYHFPMNATFDITEMKQLLTLTSLDSEDSKVVNEIIDERANNLVLVVENVKMRG